MYTKRHKLGIFVKSLDDGSKKIAETTRGPLSLSLWETFANLREVHQIASPKFELVTYASGCVVEGHEVLTVRRGKHGAQHGANPGGPVQPAIGGRQVPIVVRTERGGGLEEMHNRLMDELHQCEKAVEN